MKKEFHFKILAIIVLPVLFLFILEISSFLILKNFEKENKFDMKKFISKKNSSFKSIPDFEKVKAQLIGKSCKKIIFYDPKSQLPYYSEQNHKCEGETVENGLRKTHYQNKNSQKNIYILGGSTIWGTGASDEFTIPSIIQKKINFSNNIKTIYNVYNYGFSTLVSHQQLKLLKKINLKKNDIVIFYDGNNDIWQANINRNPHGTMIGYNNKNKVSILKNKLKFFLNNNSYFYQFVQKIRGKKNLKCTKLIIDKNKINENFNIYAKAILKAKIHTETSDAEFYHFFQPTLFTRSNKTDFEKYMISTMPSNIMPCNSKDGLFEISIQQYLKNYNKFKYQIDGTNLSDIFDKYKDDFYIDLTHLNALGNKIVANKIFNTLNLD